MPRTVLRYAANGASQWGVQFGERIAPLSVEVAGTGELLARHWERIWSLAPDPTHGTTVEVLVAAGSEAQLAEERRRVGPLLRPCAERSGMRKLAPPVLGKPGFGERHARGSGSPASMSTSRFAAASP